jgi:hypothetical protein
MRDNPVPGQGFADDLIGVSPRAAYGAHPRALIYSLQATGLTRSARL